MKKNINLLLRGSILLIGMIILFVVLNFILSNQQQASSMGNGIQTLQARLEQSGIPVKSLTVTRQSPLEVEVILSSTSNDEKMSNEDMLHEFITVRELELAHLNLGLPVGAYRLVLTTANDKSIYDSEIFLNSDLPSQKLTQKSLSTIKMSEVKVILENNLDFAGFKLLALDISPEFLAHNNCMFVAVDLSTETSAENINNANIANFITNLHPQIEAMNHRFGTGIVLIHIRIMDADNHLLVDYLEDFETAKQSSWIDENYVTGWYPQPAPATDIELRETPEPIDLPTQPPPETTSLPAPTTSPAAYPPPPTQNPYP